VRCDICINNTLALSNTRMLADYASIDSRMRAMGYVVKWWAKARKLNEPYSGTLSSYAFLLMIVNFLQMRQPPVLPCLQRLAEQQPNRKVVDGFDCTYFTDIIQLRGFGSANKESVGELLAAFFRYFAYEFDYETMVLSVRLGRLLTKEEKGWGVCKEKENYLFTLEDPFELTHNLGKVVDINTLPTIRYEFVRAYKLLVENASLDEICEVYIDEEADKKKPRYYTPKKGALKNH
jgi:DNA polymerase sigma